MKVELYSRSACGYCDAARALLDGRGIAFAEIDCSGDADKRHWLVDKTGQRTLPQIFIDGVPIGGFSDLQALDKAGTLAKIVAGEAAPAPVATAK